MIARLGYAVVKNGVLILGDPDLRGTHVRIVAAGIAAYSLDTPHGVVIPWESIRGITARAPIARFRPPAWALVAAAGASASIGLDWEPPVADIPIALDVVSAGRRQSREFVCTGFVTRGYSGRHAEAIQRGLRLLAQDASARSMIIADPLRLFTSLR